VRRLVERAQIVLLTGSIGATGFSSVNSSGVRRAPSSKLT